MSQYVRQLWEDRIVEYPNRYKDQNGNILTLTEFPGNVAKEGTLVEAVKMNNIENGISNLYNAFKIAKTTKEKITSTWKMGRINYPIGMNKDNCFILNFKINIYDENDNLVKSFSRWALSGSYENEIRYTDNDIFFSIFLDNYDSGQTADTDITNYYIEIVFLFMNNDLDFSSIAEENDFVTDITFDDNSLVISFLNKEKKHIYFSNFDRRIRDNSNRINRIETDLFDSGSASGTSINLKDSAMAEYQELSVDGVCEQETTAGKNFLSEKTEGAKNTYFYRNNGFEVKGGITYTISCDIAIAAIYVTKTDETTLFVAYSKALLTFTSAEDALVYFNFYFTGDRPTKYQLEIGSTVTEYEPYTGGQPSPNPDYPQPIKVIEEDFDLVSCGKNLQSNTFTSITLNGVTFTKNEDGTILVNGTCGVGGISAYIDGNNYLSLPAGTYILGSDDTFGSSDTYFLYSDPYDKNGIAMPQKYLSSSSNAQTYDDIVKIRTRIVIREGQVLNNILFKPQIEKSNVRTSYEPHQETKITITLPENEFVGKIDDTYKDILKVEYNEEDGQYHKVLVKNIGKYILSNPVSIETTTAFGTQFKYSSFSITDVLQKGRHYSFICDRVHKANEQYSAYGGYFVNNAFVVMTDENDTLESFNEKISGSILYYPLATPYVIDLGVVDMPITYNEITNIFTDSDLMPNINIKYYRNFTETVKNLQINNDTLKNELANIESRLSALENA